MGDKTLFKNIFHRKASVFGLIASSLAFICMPLMAFADDATTAGAVLCNMFDNLKPMGSVFQWLAYVAGTFFTVQGIFHLHRHHENHREHRLHTPLMLFFGAAMLLALPSVVNTIITTLYGTAGSGGTLACNQGSGTSSAQVLDVMLTNFVGNIKGPMISLVSLISIVSGLFMIIRGLVKASRFGFDPKTNSVTNILSSLVFGAIMMAVGENLNVFVHSMFGSGVALSGNTSGTVTAWKFVSAVGGGSEQFGAAVAAALNFIQVIGVISFVRGWLIMKKVVEGGGNATTAQGMSHILGGVCAINIGPFLKILDTTMGTGLM
jgi:hypothetical protein